MLPPARSRTARRNSTATGPSYNTPDPPSPPPARRAGVSTRGVRVVGADDTSHALQTASPASTRVAAHYSLPPTVPSPFIGTLDASLSAVLEFGREHAPRNAGIQAVIDTLLRPVESGTNWPFLLRGVFLREGGRTMVEEILFLVTRTLLPEQVAENRAAMARMYERKKSLAIRMVLRYDMMRAWVGEGVASTPPPPAVSAASTSAQTNANGHAKDGQTNGDAAVNGNEGRDVEMSDVDADTTTTHTNTIKTLWKRRTLMPNIIPTLIAAPASGYSTHGVRERMKHHPTALDTYLLLSDTAVGNWGDQTLLAMASQIVLQWQWLRQNNDMLDDMEVFGYEEVEGKADECEWIVDGGGKSRRSGVGVGVENAGE